MNNDPREGYAREAASRISRRTFLKGAVSLGAASVSAPLLWTTSASASKKKKRRSRSANKKQDPAATTSTSTAGSYIKNVIICSQENRSFDHYYGYATPVKNAGYGPPANYAQSGQKPWHFKTLSTPDIGHSWTAVHGEWDNGKMDGFYSTDGKNALGYYTQQDLPFYYSLFNDSTLPAALCVNYFCSVLGPTYPNRFYLASGTSGGITDNALYGYGKFQSSTWPIILDLLEDHGVSWKVYNVDQFSDDPVSQGESDNVFVFWDRWQNDQRTRASKQNYLDDVQNGTLPQVSFIIDSYTKNYDEHPGFKTNIQTGMGIQQQLITALQKQPKYWDKTQNNAAAYIFTYDEHGGFFDHILPPKLDAFGAGIRVPTWVISPYANTAGNTGTNGNRLVATSLPSEHSSILKFLETVFGLPTLASINHTFDSSTPGGADYQAAGGKATGPPAPPRDGLTAISNLTEMFLFS